jgi:hypothetical protein
LLPAKPKLLLLSRIVETGGSKATRDKLPPKLGRIVDGVFCEAAFACALQHAGPLSGASKRHLNRDFQSGLAVARRLDLIQHLELSD